MKIEEEIKLRKLEPEEEIKLIKLEASEGKIIISKASDKNGYPVIKSKEIYLSSIDSPDNYLEVDDDTEE